VSPGGNVRRGRESERGGVGVSRLDQRREGGGGAIGRAPTREGVGPDDRE
jgi:hypothetical protein